MSPLAHLVCGSLPPACFHPQAFTLPSCPRLSVPHADGEGGTTATRVSQTAGGGFPHSSGVQSVFLPFCMWCTLTSIDRLVIGETIGRHKFALMCV